MSGIDDDAFHLSIRLQAVELATFHRRTHVAPPRLIQMSDQMENHIHSKRVSNPEETDRILQKGHRNR